MNATPRLLALLLIYGASCAAPATQTPTTSLSESIAVPASAPQNPSSSVTNDLPVTSTLPAWRSMSLLEFEAFLETVARHGELSEDLYAELSAQMVRDDQAQLAMRAALVLARVDTRASARLLLAQLEARHEHPERPADAADVVAAASLATSLYTDELSIAARLGQLADGAAPHPDLEVRTECARTALLLGNRAVVPYLLRLTRLDTPLGLARDGAWHSTEFTTWSRNRAAETLAELLGIACPYRADNNLAGREVAAQALEDAWQGAH